MWNYFELKKIHAVVVIFFALFLVGVIFPWREVFGDGYFAHHRIVQLIFLTFIAVYLMSHQWRKAVIRREDKWLRIGAALFYAGGLVSLGLGMSVTQAGLEYLHWVLLGILFISCAGVSSDLYVKPLAIIFLVAHGLLIFLAILYLLFALLEGDPLQAIVIYPATENIRFFNQIQIFVLPLLLLLLKYPRVGYLAFIFFTANALLLCVGGARGAGLALSVILFIVAVAVPSMRGNVIRASLASLLSLIIYAILWWIGVEGLHDISRSGTAGRAEMWLEIIRNLQWHHLVWGIGPANYVLFGQLYSFGHPHNSVLQWILEWGGISFLGATLIVSRILYKATVYVKQMPSDLFTLGLLLSWLAALAYSLVDGVIVMPIAQTLFVAFAGLLWGRVSGRPASTTDAEDANNLTGPMNVVKSCMAGLLVLLITVPYIYLASQYYVQQSSTCSDTSGPRFWVNGTPLLFPE